MKQSLQLKLSQSLTLTPQLQQSIKLLQISTLEMNQELERYLLENPLLEREDDDEGWSSPATSESVGEGNNELRTSSDASSDSMSDALTDTHADSSPSDDLPPVDDDAWSFSESNYPSTPSHDDDDESEAHDLHAAGTSLGEHLNWQLAMTPLSERDRGFVMVLIDALDDDGYLKQTFDELLGVIPDEWEPELDDLQIALRHLQAFDPVGVGARTPQECLRLQLLGLPEDSVRALALALVDEHLELLAARDFTRLRKALNVGDDDLRAAQHLIQQLNPRPGAPFAPIDTRYIIPDVIVRKIRGQWSAAINPDAYPRIRVNRMYAEILRHQRGSGLTSQLQEARWLINSIEQRFDTILRVTQEIVDRQRQFFDHGEVAMRPLVLREISEALELHESTVSRVTTQKYMATPRGIFELKYFFGSHVATEAGGACSATAIRALIKQLVAAENPKKPLSDNQISEILGQQGIVVARRTIAKYREAIGISPASLRKTL